MTRKRFKKLLMGRFGYPKRDAEYAARRIVEENDSYDNIYYSYLLFIFDYGAVEKGGKK